MIKANHSIVHQWLLNAYIGFILKTDFRDVIITGNVKPDNRSILLIANHFGWWDGFFAWYINQKLLKKRFHVMMLEEELAKRMFFSRVGAFSVNHKSKTILESLGYSAELLKNSNNLVVMYPQGKLGSQHLWEVKFQKGVERILEMAENTRVVFSVCLTDFFQNRKPTLTIALCDYTGERSLDKIEFEFNKHLQNSVLNQHKLFTP
jgi:1-acyl-sn-glycerol-3-phosphate acyltransferase